MERYQDINISDNVFKNDYSNKFINGQYQSAFNILNNEELNSKSFIAEIVNNISNVLYYLEQDYYSNTIDYFSNLNNDFQTVIDNYKYIGDWSNTQIYRIYNIVTNSSKYYMYINKTPKAGMSLNDSSYWLEFTLKGEKGADGIGVNFVGTWDNSTSYNALDGVYYNGAIWCCKTSNTNQQPNSSSSYWESVVTFLKAKIVSGTTEPTDKYDGLIWLEILS